MGRLLDEDDVLNAVDQRIQELQSHPEFRRKHADIDLYGIKKYISQIPTAQQWIPCSERLPHYSETVIVSILDDTGDYNLNYTDVGWITHDGTWIVDNDENNMVTAWMPLPEPWRGENSYTSVTKYKVIYGRGEEP